MIGNEKTVEKGRGHGACLHLQKEVLANGFKERRRFREGGVTHPPQGRNVLRH